MIESADKEYYGFEYADCDGKVYKTKIENAGDTWMEALDDFVNFLETVYKYDIKSKIRVQTPHYFKYMNNFEQQMDGWNGEYFDKDEEETNEEFPF
jgi:hypothetical protein